MWKIIQHVLMLILFYFLLMAISLVMGIKQRYFGSNEKKETHETNQTLAGLRIGILLYSAVLFGLFIFYSRVFERDDPNLYLCLFIGFCMFLVGVLVSVKLDQITGTSVCTQCFNNRELRYHEALIAPLNKKYIKCPCCKRKTWHRKEI